MTDEIGTVISDKINNRNDYFYYSDRDEIVKENGR